MTLIHRRLTAAQETYETKQADFRKQHAAEATRLSDARITLAHLVDVHSREAAKQNRLLAEAEVQAKRVLERQAFVAEAARRHTDVNMVFVALPTPDEVRVSHSAGAAARPSAWPALAQLHALPR